MNFKEEFVINKRGGVRVVTDDQGNIAYMAAVTVFSDGRGLLDVVYGGTKTRRFFEKSLEEGSGRGRLDSFQMNRGAGCE